jgi:hypothetical protein
VFARELVLYGFFTSVGSLAELGNGQGSQKLFVELGITDVRAALAEMKSGFARAALDACLDHVAQNKGDTPLTRAIAKLLFRKPTDFELEFMCCEGRKMLKALMLSVGAFEGERKRVKAFHGMRFPPPPIDCIPLPTATGGAVAVEEVSLAMLL